MTGINGHRILIDHFETAVLPHSRLAGCRQLSMFILVVDSVWATGWRMPRLIIATMRKAYDGIGTDESAFWLRPT